MSSSAWDSIKSPGHLEKHHHAKSPVAQLKAGSLLQMGTNAILRVTGLRKPCVKIGRLGKGLQAAVTMRGERFAFMKGAVMAVVIAGGKVLWVMPFASSSRQAPPNFCSQYRSKNRPDGEISRAPALRL